MVRSTLLHFFSQWGPESKIPGSEFSHVVGKVFLKFRCNSSCKFSTPDFVISVLCETCSGRRLNLKVEVKSVRTKWKILIFRVPRILDFPDSECFLEPAGIIFRHFDAQQRKANKWCEALSSISPPSGAQRAESKVLSFRVSSGRYF